MTLDRRSLMTTGLVAALAAGTEGRAAALAAGTEGQATAPPVAAVLAQPSETIELWPAGAAPLARANGAAPLPPTETIRERSTDPSLTSRVVWAISRPRLEVFRPERPNGAAVLLIAGGGYRVIGFDKEGYEIARWLTARGFTAFVLFYRLPAEGWALGADTPLADAQRAVRLIRQRARDYALDPERIAAMGFSAGGHVCASLSTRFAAPVYQPVDAADRLSARPHSAAPCYPVISMDPAITDAGSRALLLGPAPTPERERAWSPDRSVPADAPPHFLLHAEDDAIVPVENSLRLHAALRERKIPVEMHLFAQGGHGFGLRLASDKPVMVWPDLWRAWAAAIGLT